LEGSRAPPHRFPGAMIRSAMFAPVSYLEWEHDGARQAQAQKDWLEADARWEACDGSHVLLSAERRAICGPEPSRPPP
jgi:hypothetical protein